HSIGHLAAALVDHDPLDGPHLLAFGIIDRRAFHFVTPDETRSFPRFYRHEIPPPSVMVTPLRHLHRTHRPCPRGDGLAVFGLPDARCHAGPEQKPCHPPHLHAH